MMWLKTFRTLRKNNHLNQLKASPGFAPSFLSMVAKGAKACKRCL